jgi:hypothetical protein
MKYQLNIYINYIALAFVVLIFFSGCNTRSDELNAMLESSVATTQLTTGNEVSRRYQDRETKPLLGKPKQPEFRIEYEPINNYTKEDVYNELVRILEKNNWEREELSITQSGYYRATLPQDYFTIVAEVLIHSKSNIVSIQLVTVPH